MLEERRPFLPFIEWWSFQNIVWEGEEELPIGAKLKFEVDEFDVEYELFVSGIGGHFRILSERLDIKKIVLLEREEQILKIRHHREFIRKNTKKLRQAFPKFSEGLKVIAHPKANRVTMKRLTEQELRLPKHFRNLIQLAMPYFASTFHENLTLMVAFPDFGNRENFCFIISPPIEKQKGHPLFAHVLSELRNAIKNIIILRHPDMKMAKTPSIPKREETLVEDGSNLHNVLYNWFIGRAKLPDRIETAISRMFPDTQIGFKLTREGRVYMQVTEKGLQLDPPCISDGFYKILAVLAALELKPSLLAIDEIENSLFAGALQYLIDELRTSGTTVIATTHSPMTVDLVDLKDLLIAEKTMEGTTLNRIKNVEKLQKKLAELKITQSESWLGGALKH